jgi:hypothetical protein
MFASLGWMQIGAILVLPDAALVTQGANAE